MITNIETKQQIIEDFRSLVFPYEPHEFAKDYWGKKLLHIRRNNRHYFNHLMTIEDLDYVLDQSRPKGRSLRVVKNQIPINPSKYENEDGSINLNRIYAAYADGHTVVVHEVQRFWKPIQRLCKSLEQEFNFKTIGELFLTPKNQKALSPHYDSHDVFVVQLQGSKNWILYDEEYKTPIVNSFQPIFDRDELKNKREITLRAGEVLFIPRGVPHEAVTTNESSLHLSIGVHPSQWLDLLTMSITQIAQNDVEFREALPLGYLNKYSTFRELFQIKLENLMHKVSENLNPDFGVALLTENLRLNNKPVSDGHFAHLDKIEQININSYLKHRDYMRPGVIKTDEISRIFFEGGIVKGPEFLAPCFDFIANAKNGFIVSDIPLIGDTGKLKLVRRLVRGGLLKIVELN